MPVRIKRRRKHFKRRVKSFLRRTKIEDPSGQCLLPLFVFPGKPKHYFDFRFQQDRQRKFSSYKLLVFPGHRYGKSMKFPGNTNNGRRENILRGEFKILLKANEN